MQNVQVTIAAYSQSLKSKRIIKFPFHHKTMTVQQKFDKISMCNQFVGCFIWKWFSILHGFLCMGLGWATRDKMPIFAHFHCSFPQRKSRTYEICRAITTFTKSHGYLMNLEEVKKKVCFYHNWILMMGPQVQCTYAGLYIVYVQKICLTFIT